MPGTFPFTRGIHPTGYRGKLWTMRQFAGLRVGARDQPALQVPARARTTGLSVAFDFPTLMGYDSDHARSEGEVGKCGVAISSLADMEVLFDGIPLDQVSTSMTINGPAIILWCFYIAAAEKQGVPPEKLRGTIQNDILKEYMAQHAWCFPIEPALRLIVDCFQWGRSTRRSGTRCPFPGYHIREAGATAAQELAFTLADGFTYVERGLARGLDVDDFAPRLSFFWDIHNDFFEEIAKLRAARRIWARRLREKYGARSARSLGHALPFPDRRRHPHRAAADEQRRARRLPGARRRARRHAVAAHQLHGRDPGAPVRARRRGGAAHTTDPGVRNGVPSVADPLGGSYYVERLTDDIEREAEALFTQIEEQGGVVRGLEDGWFQKRIAGSAARQQWEIEQHRKVVVGVNEFVTDEKLTIPPADHRRAGDRASDGDADETAPDAGQRAGAAAARCAADCGARHGQPGAVHPRLRACLRDAV